MQLMVITYYCICVFMYNVVHKGLATCCWQLCGYFDLVSNMLPEIEQPLFLATCCLQDKVTTKLPATCCLVWRP